MVGRSADEKDVHHGNRGMLSVRGMTRHEWMADYLEGELQKRLKTNSHRMYHFIAAKYLPSYLGYFELTRIAANDVNDFVDILIRKELSQNTVSGALRLLRLALVMVALTVLLVGVRVIGLTPYTVLSGSMEPTYRVGSLDIPFQSAQTAISRVKLSMC